MSVLSSLVWSVLLCAKSVLCGNLASSFHLGPVCVDGWMERGSASTDTLKHPPTECRLGSGLVFSVTTILGWLATSPRWDWFVWFICLFLDSFLAGWVARKRGAEGRYDVGCGMGWLGLVIVGWVFLGSVLMLGF